MKKIILIIAISLTYIISYALPLKKAEVISDGDRGLALEWVKGIAGGIRDITRDAEGNIYVYGSINKNLSEDYIVNYRTYFVAKYTHLGKLVWLNEINTNDNDPNLTLTDSYSRILCKNNRIFFSLITVNDDIYFNKNKIFDKTGKTEVYLLEVDSQTGNYLNGTNLSGFSNQTPTFHVLNDDSKVLIGVISDGEYIANGYWRADGTGIPFQKFEGMNQTTMKTETRTHGATDYYFAKLDKDNNLVWDFTLGGKRPDYTTDSIHLMRTSLNEDTLFVYMAFFNDSIDIDPDPNHEVWVYGQEWYWGWPNFGIVLIKYDISGNKPILLGYKEHENTWFVDHNCIYSHKKKGTYMAVENPEYRKVIDGDVHLGSGDDHRFATVDSQCNINLVNSIPPTSGLNLFSPIQYLYDEQSNFFIPNNRVYSYTLDEFPIVLNFTKNHKEYVYNEVKTWFSSVSKFDDKGEYCWSLLLKNEDLDLICPDGEKGYLILYGAIYSKSTYDTDLNPDIKKSHIANSNENVNILLYRETYRISSDPTEHGEVTVPDTFAWHGRDYEIGVTPDEGYHLEKLTANGEEIKADTDGKYYVKNVKEPICINAKFAVGAGIEDSKANNIEITPNIIDKTLTVNSSIAFTSFSLSDMNGRVLKEGTFTQDIDVSGLTPGRYQITLRNKNTNKTGTFIKR